MRDDNWKGNWPLKNDRDEPACAPTAPLSEVGGTFSFAWAPELTFKPKTWIVPLSLETANHWAVVEKAKLYISALSAPLLTYGYSIE